MSGEVRFTYKPAHIHVIDAPKEVSISLAVLQDCPKEALLIYNSNMLIFAPYTDSAVTYEIVGFNRYLGVLELSRINYGDDEE